MEFLRIVWAVVFGVLFIAIIGLNPCCSGRWSRTQM